LTRQIWIIISFYHMILIQKSRFTIFMGNDTNGIDWENN
jgi:hypothetical protein